LKSGGGFDRAGTFYPNGTGFVRIEWPTFWENVTVIVKAKSYQGECITAGTPFSGLIVYWLTVSPTQGFLNYFDPSGTLAPTNVATFNDDGTLDVWDDNDGDGVTYDDLQTLVATPANVISVGSNLRSGPVDIVGDLAPDDFAGNFSSPANAWVARASYIFKVFHEHTWYGTDDVLTYAIIFIYDVDHTQANSERSLLQAAITGSDGQSRYTKDIYPRSQGLGGGRYAQNRLVPIPLQAINLGAKQAFVGGIGAPGSGDRILAPHLNATKRVWWETVLTNQTFYVGREYNGSASYTTIDGKNRPDFGGFADDPTIPAVTQGGITGIPAGPLSIVHNNTVYAAINGLSSWSLLEDIENVANFQNNTVFYARFCVQDADLSIQHPEVGDKLVDAEVTINLKKKPDTPYYLSHNILTTDNGGCTDDPHKWPGYMDQFRNYARFPNGTNWGLRGSLNVSKAFDPKDDKGPAWSPGGYFERAWGGSWTGPYVNAGKNYSALIPMIKYMKTRTLADDPDYDGFDVQVKWKGGSRNGYGGTAVLVDSVRVRNPYAIAAMFDWVNGDIFGEWIFPSTTLVNSKTYIKIHHAVSLTIEYDQIYDTDGDGEPDTTVPVTITYDDVSGITLELIGVSDLYIYDGDGLGRVDVEAFPTGVYMLVNIVEDLTDPWVDFDNVTYVYIDDAVVTIKRDYIVDYFDLEFVAGVATIDFNLDGTIDYTGISEVELDGGVAEIEIWTPPLGSEQAESDLITILITINSYDFLDIYDADGNYISLPYRAGPAKLLIRGPIQDIYIEINGADWGWVFYPQANPPSGIDELSLDGRLGIPPTHTTVRRSFDAGDGVDFFTGIVGFQMPRSKITYLDFDDDSEVGFQPLFPDNATATLYRGSLVWYDDGTGTSPWAFGPSAAGFTGTATTGPMDTTFGGYLYEAVVPLTDFGADDDQWDNRIFAGYDDFAPLGSGTVFITAWVHDIAFKLVDNMGNPLPATNTAVVLTRLNGPDVVKAGAGVDPDRLVGGLLWSYKMHGEGMAVFYQLPGEYAYGVVVKLDGVVVYDNPAEIPKLTKTEIITIVANVFKLKVLLLDCNGNTLGPAYLSYIDQTGARRITLVDDFGARDFGFVPAGGLQFTGVWWKGVLVKFVKAEVGDRQLTLEPDGTLKIGIDSNVDSPVKLYANIIDIVLTPWDYNKDNRIPRLNITLTWVGEHPLTGRKLWYLETMDPTGDTDPAPFNTTLSVDQFLRYTVKYFQGESQTSGELKSYGKAEYVFYQMPPTLYNITVTTVTDPRYDIENEQTPGNSKWPGRDVPVPYEIKIKYKDTSTPPEILTEPGDAINDRVVLRVFSTLNPDGTHYGTPVSESWPFRGALDVLNPGRVGDFSGVTACESRRDLLVWAHTFYKRIVDGDGQRRIGDATYLIVNDNEVSMEFYNPKDGFIYPEHYSFWTEDTVDATWLKKDSQFSSVIWWNGSYRAERLALPTNMSSTVDHMSFTVDQWWNSSVDPTKVWPRHNFTVQPSRAHFEVMDKNYVGNWTKIEDTVKPYGNAIIFEKQTLLLPAPVTFVEARAIDKGGAPLEKALIEAWILDLNTSKRVRIDTADTGSDVADGLQVAWTWELKRVADPDTPQRFKMVRWDRVYLTLTAFAPPPPSGETFSYDAGDAFADDPAEPDDIVIKVGNITHFTTSASIFIPAGETLTLQFHTSGTVTIMTSTSTVITVNPGDIITFSGGLFGAIITIPPSMIVTVVGVSDPDNTVFTTPGSLEFLPSIAPTAPESKTILVQVPPYPAKLYLRDVVGDFDIVVTARDVTVLVDDSDTPDGLLSYGQWETDATGHIPSFTLPDYKGLLLLPTSGWLAATYADDPEVEEFHYQFNVVWKSAVVYSDNYILDKKPVVFGASEVYDVTFLYTLSNSTRREDAVRNLNLWIYYPNVTEWWRQKLWNVTLPVDYVAPLDTGRLPAPQDYRACSDSVFGCALRVTLISSADADGVVEFSKIPGPRFMNTTWKYVFSANHSAITWLDDLVATQFVLNNETFGDGPLKTVTTSRITVPIMLNAAHQLRFLVLGWRDEQGQPTAYPLEGFTVRYEIRRKDAGLTVASGTTTSATDGTAEIRSDPTDPRKVLWAGLTVRYRVEPPSWLVNVNDAKWKELLGARNVQIVEASGYTPDARPSIGAYFPDEVPTHFAITEISTRFVDGWCFGLCTAYIDGRQQSKPYVINVDYTLVTVRALDFNGRPLRGAFVEIVERASGRVAGWSYTFGATWKRQPVDLITLYDFHRVQLLPARDVGGDGYTEFMPVAVGPWNYDANNDDRVDASGYRGDDPRTPAIEGTPLQFIVRVYWLATDDNPDNANGDLRAIWPFIDPQKPWSTTEAGVSVRKSHVKVYDSDFDETDAAAKTLLVPIDSTVTIRKPSDVIWKYNGAHRDVTTAVFDFKALLNYEGKTLPDSIKNRIEVWVYRKTGAVTELALRFRAGPTIDTVTVNRLPRGVYEIEVRFIPTGAAIFRRTFDISVVNVGTVQAEAALPFTDLSFEVTDMKGRPLPIAPEAVRVEPADVYDKVSVAGNVVTIGALYTGAPVTITVSYSSPVYGTSADVRVTDTADGLKARLLGGRTLQLPVDDVTVTVVDRKGQPMGGAVVKLGAAPAKSTGGDGRAVFERVPLESAGRGITYSLSVSVGGVEVTPADARSVELSTARTSVTVIGELFSLPVRVIGTLGQGLAGANVRVVKGAVTVASASTDQGGFAQFDRLVLDTYTVVANYKGYTQEVTVSSADLQAGKVVEITLPIYTELLGIPMPLSTLLALIIGLILLVVVIAIIVSEYRWWRGRRLGVYPPAPPKAPK
jgi:hypothetical protein